MTIILMELTGRDEVWRFSTDRYNHPSAPGDYQGRLREVPDYVARVLAGGDEIGGRADVSNGRAVIVNNDGAVDGLADAMIAGRAFRLLAVEDNQADYSSAVVLVRGVCAPPQYDKSQIVVTLRGKDEEYDMPIQAVTYAGTSTGAGTGVEGGAEVKGAYKPLLLGRVWNLEPVLVNQGLAIYQVSAKPGAINGVRIAGVPVTAGTAYASFADLQNVALAPLAGTYRVYSGAEGLFIRLANVAQFVLHVDGQAGASGADRYPGAIAASLLDDMGQDYDAASLAVLNAAFSYQTGLWTGTGRVSLADALDSLMRDCGAYWTELPNGDIRFDRVPVPDIDDAGINIKAFTPDDPGGIDDRALISWDQIGRDAGDGVPVYRVEVGYRRNYRVLTVSELAGDASSPSDPVGGSVIRGQLGAEYQGPAAWQDSGVLTDYPTARTIRIDTGLDTEAGAQALADYISALLGVRRDRIAVEVAIDAGQDIDIGDVVTITTGRYGVVNKPAAVVGRTLRGQERQIRLEVMG